MHDPVMMEYAALGRGLLGDRLLVPELIEKLDECACWASTRGVTRALAWTGDVRAVRPLLRILADAKRSG